MVAAGCWPVFDMTRHAAMLLGAVSVLGRAARMIATCERYLRRFPFDAAVVIDSPTLHLPLAARANAVGIPVLYYIAPQLWAWGASRIHRLRDRVDHLAVILPFEEAYFRDRGVDATYVGHPLADAVASEQLDLDVIRAIRGRGSPVVALLPGSRRHVVREVLPGQLDVARRIAADMPGAVFAASVANRDVAPIIEPAVASAGVAVSTPRARLAELIRAADLVLVASGTTTLEVALHERPMIVMYNASRLLYHAIGRWIVNTPHLSLPNILAGRTIVPEFMPYYRSAAPIAEHAIRLLQDTDARAAIAEALARAVRPIRIPGAAGRTAALLRRMIAHPHA